MRSMCPTCLVLLDLVTLIIFGEIIIIIIIIIIIEFSFLLFFLVPGCLRLLSSTLIEWIIITWFILFCFIYLLFLCCICNWYLPTSLHGAKTQKNIIIILAAVKT
jgi:hypothetical protein